MPAMKVWDGTAWQTVSQGPPGAFPVTSVDGRTGAVTLADLYVPRAGTPLVQNGTANATTDSNGQIWVGFAVAYSAAPSVIALAQNQAAPPGAYFTAMHIMATNAFMFRIFNDGGAPMTNTVFGFTWIAAGPR